MSETLGSNGLVFEGRRPSGRRGQTAGQEDDDKMSERFSSVTFKGGKETKEFEYNLSPSHRGRYENVL